MSISRSKFVATKMRPTLPTVQVCCALMLPPVVCGCLPSESETGDATDTTVVGIVFDYGALNAPDAPNKDLGTRRWAATTLRYTFLNGTPDLPIETARTAIENALRVWSCATGLKFASTDSFSAEIQFGWFAGEHGDTQAFDGPSDSLGSRSELSNALAHAYLPPQQGKPRGLYAGLVHFDEDEFWSDDVSATLKVDLTTVALHEIGHALGLTHSKQETSIMFPKYSGPRRGVAQADINDVRGRYQTSPIDSPECQ